MKFPLLRALLLLGLGLAAGCASSNPKPGGGGAATVTFVDPETYTDFRGSGPSGDADREKMIEELDTFIRGEARRTLPPGRDLDVRITNIDQGGKTSARRGSGLRVTSSDTSAQVDVEYTLTDGGGRVLKAGRDQLVQSASTMAFPELSTEDMALVKNALRSWIRRLSKL